MYLTAEPPIIRLRTMTRRKVSEWLSLGIWVLGLLASILMTYLGQRFMLTISQEFCT